MLEQVGFFIVIDAHVQVIECAWEKVVDFSGHIQNMANSGNKTYGVDKFVFGYRLLFGYFAFLT